MRLRSAFSDAVKRRLISSIYLFTSCRSYPLRESRNATMFFSSFPISATIHKDFSDNIMINHL